MSIFKVKLFKIKYLNLQHIARASTLMSLKKTINSNVRKAQLSGGLLNGKLLVPDGDLCLSNGINCMIFDAFVPPGVVCFPKSADNSFGISLVSKLFGL